MGVETWIAIGKFVGAIFGYGSAGTGWYYFAVTVARIATLAIAAKHLSPKADLSQAAHEKLHTVKDSIHPQRFVYGEDMLSGPIIYGQVSGTKNEHMTLAVELVGHEVDSVVAYRLDDVDIPLTDITGSDVTGGRLSGVASVNMLLGTQTQNCAAMLSTDFPALFGASTHRGLGHTYMVWKFTLEDDNNAFEAGAPQNLRAIIKGKKVYDPRLDDTNGGTGAHRLATPSTWEWSANPALCLADFIRDEKFGMKEDDARVNWPLVIDAADICEQTVTIPSSTQDRYTCNATFQSTEKRGEVRDALLNAMLGRMVFTQGVWCMWAGAAITPDVTLTESNLSGGVTVQASAGAKERYNRVRGKFIDPSRNYTASTYPELRSSTYETEDGDEVRPLVADFLATNNNFEAQRKGIATLKQSRQQRIVHYSGNMSCFRIQPGSTVLLDMAEYGFSGEKFFVSEWAMSEKGVELTLVEEVDSAWDDPLVGEYVTRSATGVIAYGDLAVPPPTSVTADSATGGVQLAWTSPPLAVVSDVEVWGSDDNVRGNAVLVATVKGASYLDQVGDGRTRYYWLRSVSGIGVRSTWEPNLTTTTLTGNNTSAPADGADGDLSLTANATNQSHSVPVTNAGVEDWTGSGGAAHAYEGADLLELNTNTQTAAFPAGVGKFNINITKVSGDTLTEPAITGAGTAQANIADWAGNLTQVTVYRINYYMRSTLNLTGLFALDVTLSPGNQGADGEYRDIKFKRSTTAPATPTGDNPAGWTDDVPAGTDTLWSVTGTKTAAGVLVGVWSTPGIVSGLVYRNAYAAGTAYILHDVVTYQERSYICVLPTTGNAPSGTNAGNTQWDLLAGKGDTGDPPTTFNETIAITGSGPVNLRSLANAHSPAYDGIANATIIFQLGAGVTITGNAGGGHGIDTGSWPASPTIDLKLEVTGTVRGGGGSGGNGGIGATAGNGAGGGDGGDAIYLQEPMVSGILVNSGGVVQASGGGAGGGGGAEYPASEPLPHGGGGGGGGFPNGAGGTKGSGGVGATNGAAGTGSGGGAKGNGSGNAGDGGAGGNVNTVGASGANGTGSLNNGTGGTGGARGYAVRKNGHSATVTNNGTITGTQG